MKNPLIAAPQATAEWRQNDHNRQLLTTNQKGSTFDKEDRAFSLCVDRRRVASQYQAHLYDLMKTEPSMANSFPSFLTDVNPVTPVASGGGTL